MVEERKPRINIPQPPQWVLFAGLAVVVVIYFWRQSAQAQQVDDEQEDAQQVVEGLFFRPGIIQRRLQERRF